MQERPCSGFADRNMLSACLMRTCVTEQLLGADWPFLHEPRQQGSLRCLIAIAKACA